MLGACGCFRIIYHCMVSVSEQYEIDRALVQSLDGKCIPHDEI